jgi:phosphate uptake regulator
MLTFDAIEENFIFIVLETQKQVATTLELLRSPQDIDTENFFNRDDYIDNLKTVIENETYSRVNVEEDVTREDINTIRAIHTVSVNLERIADNCVNIVRQYDYLTTPSLIESYEYVQMFETLSNGLALIVPVFENRDLSGALDICKAENDLDILYDKAYDRIIGELKSGKDTEDLVTLLFIFRYLERMGDSLLNIGEALIFAIVGERIKISKFLSLQHTLTQSGFENGMSDLDLKGILGTRSGCRTSRVGKRGATEPPAQESLFKEGNREKMHAERRNLELWNGVIPGLVPRVFGFNETKFGASMLVEFLRGATIQETLLGADEAAVDEAVDALIGTVEVVWVKTHSESRTAIGYIEELRERLDAVLAIHPGFRRDALRIGSASVLSTNDILEACASIEKFIPAPCTVFVHGDFNANNILCEPGKRKIHFVDLYRSHDADYILDVSVFLVSVFRLPVFDRELRARLNRVVERFHAFAVSIANRWEDDTFDARLALALARSFYTSTRFELNAEFAKEMYLRAQYLLEKMIEFEAGGGRWHDFKLPVNVLFY